MTKRKMCLAVLMFSANLQSAMAATEFVPDKLVSRNFAEDPTLDLTDNPLGKVQGFPKEMVTYRCGETCDKEPYQHVLLDKKGRITYINNSLGVKKYEYGGQHNMPISSSEGWWKDGHFSTTKFMRDKYGNHTHTIYSDGVVKLAFFRGGEKIQVKSRNLSGVGG